MNESPEQGNSEDPKANSLSSEGKNRKTINVASRT